MYRCSADLSWSQTSVSVQVDNKGRNFLHLAVQNSDIESVLFLISVQANVNSRVQDAAKLTPLHLAVQAGSEIIVRNLVDLQFFFPLSPAFTVHVHFKCYWKSGAVDAVFILHFSCFQLLAGAKVNELTKHRQTALHLAAQQDLATICSVLLENGVDFAAEDENGNNGTLHSSFFVMSMMLLLNKLHPNWQVLHSIQRLGYLSFSLSHY